LKDDYKSNEDLLLYKDLLKDDNEIKINNDSNKIK
jgi:hypothetical protein